MESVSSSDNLRNIDTEVIAVAKSKRVKIKDNRHTQKDCWEIAPSTSVNW